MRSASSIRARLSLVFLFLFLLVIVLGLEGLSSLSYVNDTSAQIRDRWLPSTRALGDLNNLTTDFPAAEATLRRTTSRRERATTLQQVALLDGGIAAAERAYRRIHHDATEDDLYRRFEAKWREYRGIVAHNLPSPPAVAHAESKILNAQGANSANDADAADKFLHTQEANPAHDGDAASELLHAQEADSAHDAAGELLHAQEANSAYDADTASELLHAQEANSAYDAASELLGMLTERNLASARLASESSDLAYSQAQRRIALTILLAGLLVAGAMVHVTRSISAPLVELAASMHRLAASETSIDVNGTQRHDEIGEMARAVVVFRNNAIDLASNRHTLALQAAMLQEKLAEEQRLTLLQRNFVSMASHEFRTPLAIIDGNTQRLIALRERLSADELAGRARKMVRRMTQLIDNLIGSARLIDGPIELYYHPTQVDLHALVRETCHLQRELTPDAQIVELGETQSLVVYGDAILLFQLFSNLLSNAVKYSPDGGLIRVTPRLEGTQIVVAIEDCGIGIPEPDQDRVFERYYRGSNTSGIAGSGVGLSLVKAIVDLHKGAISLDSREGGGSRFTVRLPAGPAEAAGPARERSERVLD
jgi:signal transduction histidine kinase